MELGWQIFTWIHVLISLVGIVTGVVVTYGLLNSQRYDQWTLWFLATTVLTSVTGFFFPFKGVTPAHILGLLSLALLWQAIYARYINKLEGVSRLMYVNCAIFALYLNFFVLIVQAFQKIPALHALAPTQKEYPFAVAQLICLVGFAVSGFYATRRFRPPSLDLAKK